MLLINFYERPKLALSVHPNAILSQNIPNPKAKNTQIVAKWIKIHKIL
jgi:hypothetical protein